MSESFLTAGFLSLSGGLHDAYTYMSRGKVFANAQTGNIVLLSQSIGSGDWPLAIHYLVPLLSFALGVAAAELIRQTFQNIRKVHWRQLVLIIEIFLSFAIALASCWSSGCSSISSRMNISEKLTSSNRQKKETRTKKS